MRDDLTKASPAGRTAAVLPELVSVRFSTPGYCEAVEAYRERAREVAAVLEPEGDVVMMTGGGVTP
jgi:transposase